MQQSFPQPLVNCDHWPAVAQAKPKAYQVTELEIIDAEAWKTTVQAVRALALFVGAACHLVADRTRCHAGYLLDEGE